MSANPSTPAPEGIDPGLAGLRDDDMPSDEETAAMRAEAEVFRQPAPPPMPVRDRFYLTECEHCGWIGSSEQCGGHDDEVVCPVCCHSIAGDESNQVGAAKHGEAVYQRILAAEDEAAGLRAERDAAVADCQALTRALTGLTSGGSEFFVRRGDDCVADIDRCVDHVRGRRRQTQERLLDWIRQAREANERAEAAEAARVAAVERVERERDAAISVSEMNATSGGFYARHAENAQATADALRQENATLRAALTTSEYLSDRYRTAWQGKPVRDLDEAEGAHTAARAALARHPEPADTRGRTERTDHVD